MSTQASSSTGVIPRLLAQAPLFFGTLIALTVALLVWHHYGMERVYELSSRSGHVVAGITDSEGGGASSASLTKTKEGALHLHCKLVKKAPWPYCKYAFTLGEGGNGVDLSDFDYLTLQAKYPGAGLRHVRVTITDFEFGLSTMDDWRTHKVSEIDAFELPPSGQITLPMSLFQTAVWWKEIARLPVLRTNMRIDNVIQVGVQTAAYNATGDQDITLQAIRFHGKWISQTQLLAFLVALWIICAVAWPLFLAALLRNELKTSKAEVKLLADLNRVLKLETEELAGQAQTDALTGVLNRQGLRSLLMHPANLPAPPTAIVFIDIDHFKKVNDTHGYDVGDQVLQEFAATVKATIRSSDSLVRWGGEEFLLLCPSTDVGQASALAEKLRAKLASSTWPYDLHVTASFGVAEHVQGEDIGQVVQRADAELYSAKRAGRNRVHSFGLPRVAIEPSPEVTHIV